VAGRLNPCHVWHLPPLTFKLWWYRMDNYALVERLGQGSFAIVWKARRKSDNRLVAVKQLKQAPSTWEECKRLPEIRAAALVRGQPHVINLLEAIRHGGELFLVFEYAESDLYRCLGPCERRRFEEPQVRWVMRQLFAGLAACHAAHLVHCDVKPENILLFPRLGPCGEPVLKLCDLGQATNAGECDSYVGTRWYRSPELLIGIANGGVEIDLWAAGCFFAELILLRPPFPGTDTRDMLFRICSALGAPEEGWSLSERLMQASGLRFAPSAAEGPLWYELSSTGASSSAVEIVRGLLRYDQGKRLSAARALQSSFFQGDAPEVPVVPPDKTSDKRSVEGMARSRDEAKAVSRKLQAASGARGPSPFAAGPGAGPSPFAAPPGAFPNGGDPNGFSRGLGGLGLNTRDMGSVMDDDARLRASASSPSLPSSTSPPAGYSGLGHGHSLSTSSSSQVVGLREVPAADDSLLGFSSMGIRRTNQRGQPDQVPVAQGNMAQQQRRVMQQQAVAAQQIRANRAPRDLPQGMALNAGAGLPPPSRDLHPNVQSRGGGPSLAGPSLSHHSADRPPQIRVENMLPIEEPRSPTSSGDSPISHVPLPKAKLSGSRVARGRGPSKENRSADECGRESAGEGDDEELAAKFWSQVEQSRR